MKVKRKIIRIDEKKCDGCGLCVPDCPEGALQIIDGKARLVSDLLCDGLGACLGACPQEAIVIEEREAEEYDERKAMANMVKYGKNTLKAHLKHLKDHSQKKFLAEALEFLKEKGIENPLLEEDMTKKQNAVNAACGCPGAKMVDLRGANNSPDDADTEAKSHLRQWPVQLHLVSTMAPYFQEADVVLAADCVAYAFGGFHARFLRGKSLAIACPKLDDGQDIYLEKIQSLIEDSKINTLSVLTMEVPCCMGLLGLVQQALKNSRRKAPVKHTVIGIQGGIKSENWI